MSDTESEINGLPLSFSFFLICSSTILDMVSADPVDKSLVRAKISDSELCILLLLPFPYMLFGRWRMR